MSDSSRDDGVTDPIVLLSREAHSRGEEIYQLTKGNGKANARDRHLLMRLAEHLVEQVMINQEGCVTEVFSKYGGPFDLYQHQLHVALLSVLQAKALNIAARHLPTICVGALLRDIGMFDLYESTDKKMEPLTEHELNVIRTHSLKGPRIASDQLGLGPEIAAVIAQHHEYWDGSGYPDKKSGLDINIHSRIVCLADGYCAATVARPYRAALHPVEAMRTVTALAGRRYQRELVDNLVRTVGVYPLGCRVQLNTGQIATVKRTNENALMKPVVTLRMQGELQDLDLSTRPDLFVQGKA